MKILLAFVIVVNSSIKVDRRKYAIFVVVIIHVVPSNSLISTSQLFQKSYLLKLLFHIVYWFTATIHFILAITTRFIMAFVVDLIDEKNKALQTKYKNLWHFINLSIMDWIKEYCWLTRLIFGWTESMEELKIKLKLNEHDIGKIDSIVGVVVVTDY